jgi:hypothetical protein
MRHQTKISYHSVARSLPIFGVSLNPITGTWSAFNGETLTILSEHRSAAQAHGACRRYEEKAYRRMIAGGPLPGLAHRAV